MCGILGIVKFNKNKEYSNPSMRFLLNRGPDGIGQYNDDDVILCHARLAVIDEKESSSQPLINGDFVLICNGEVYNFEEIKKIGNYVYSSTSDCEAIIHVYKNFGIEGFNHLDGTFSFTLYDKKNKKLILHRDNIGKKPLFFLNDENSFIFASNVTAISDNCPKKLTLNRDQIDFYLKNGFISPKETFLKEIKPVLPGEIYEIDIASKKVNKSFLNKKCPDYKNFDFLNYALIQEKIEELVSEAVLKRLKNIKQPVLLFSGGVDSTVLAYYMAKYHPRVNLVSMKQPIRFLNDEPFLRYAAKKLGKEVNFVKIFNKKFYEEIERFIRNLDQPLALYSYYFLSALAMKAKEYGKVLFTGDGGDEVFYGYQDISNWFVEDNIVKLPEILVGPAPKISLSDWGLESIYLGLLGHAFVKIDKATAENQMEARCPFLDWNLMCFVRSIPREYWEKFNIPKYPLKRILLEKGFSNSFVNRKKIGFSYPFRYSMVFKYPYLMDYLKKNLTIIRNFLGIEIKKLSYIDLFKNFDFYWKIFVLLKFLEHNKSILL